MLPVVSAARSRNAPARASRNALEQVPDMTYLSFQSFRPQNNIINQLRRTHRRNRKRIISLFRLGDPARETERATRLVNLATQHATGAAVRKQRKSPTSRAVLRGTY